MSPESQLADLVDDHLGRLHDRERFVCCVAIGLAKIGDAVLEAQNRTGDWGRMLADLRSGIEHVDLGLDRLRGEPGFEGFVLVAKRQSAFAASLMEAVARLRSDDSPSS